MKRTATIRASSNCNLYSLSRSELLFILQVYPDIADNIQELAKARLVGDKSRK